MVRIEQFVDINCPLPGVFAFMQDFSNHMRFSTAFKETRQLSAGSVGVGTRILRVSQFLGKEIVTEQEVIAYEANRLIRLQTISGPVTGDEDFIFEQANGATRVTVILKSDPPGVFALALPFLKAKIKSQLAQDLLRLKWLLETRN
jgi:uncharacterized membrane protein